ncbi:transformation/transcription domain-associated protein [Paragonimus westermani]|uniref:Transformation/transcription domain-associated protein n=1 Tax=Paragonimus westermani TaxID=34504 RepID=A0A5J4NIA9_9TREM|nr:transformation/transcription domain-associated protein [Paragonimus westermani]
MRLLKLCFNSVTMVDTENEHVMKLHLRRIVQGSMQCCLTAKEPTAYLTLLRTLFRSIGGGAHDKLYREFFPLLPEMLSTLNRLLRSPHWANARDLLGELCVIVPVRLSTLLPYLSLLMEPLIYVLNCNTVNQGLRTLELCVDNMQPDFLHEHLHQVRGDMLLALYNSLHSSSDGVQKMAFKVLGKLGRFNRLNLNEVQRLRLDSAEGETGPQLRMFMNEFQTQPLDMPVRCLVDAAIEILQDPNVDQPTKVRAWDFLKSVCIAALDIPLVQNLQCDTFYDHFRKDAFLSKVKWFISKTTSDDEYTNGTRSLFQSPDNLDDDLDSSVMIRVLAGLFLAGLNKPLRETHGDFITFIVRHLTLVSVFEHLSHICSDETVISSESTDLGPPVLRLDSFNPTACPDLGSTHMIHNASPPPPKLFQASFEPGSFAAARLLRTVGCSHNASALSAKPVLNSTLLVDAILFGMAHEDKQLIQPMAELLEIVHETVCVLFRATQTDGDCAESTVANRVSKAVLRLPLYNRLAHVVVDMLHHPAWYVKWGGCATIISLFRLVHPNWFVIHLLPILRGLLHCIHDLSGQMSQGALCVARDCGRLLIQTVFSTASEILTSEEPPSSQNSLGEESSRDDTAVRYGIGCKRTASGGRRRQQSTISASVRRPLHLRRGRSASTSIITPEAMSTEEQSCSERMKESKATSHKDEHSNQAIFSPADAVAVELIDALLSETASVRDEARCLLRLLSDCIERPLSVLLAPHWRSRLGHLLPPQPPLRLLEFPISTQLMILETNYFFGQAEVVRTKSKSVDSSTTSVDLHIGGVGLLRYDPTQRADRCFLIDVRSLLTQPDTISMDSGTPASETSSTTSDSLRSSIVGRITTSQSVSCGLRSVDLRVAACHILSLTWYLVNQKPHNLAALFKGICCEQDAIHAAAFLSLKEFVSHTSIDIELRHANVKPILQNVRQTTNLRLSTARQLSYCAQLFPSTFSERLCDAIYTLDLCAVLIDLFHLIPLATAKHVSLLIELVIRAERALHIEPTSPLRLPLVRFLARYPAETCVHLLTGSKWPYDAHANRILLYVLRCPHGQSVTDYLKTNHHILSDLIRPTESITFDRKSPNSLVKRCLLPRVGTPLTAACPRHLALRVVHTIHQLFPNWLLQAPPLADESPKTKARYKTMCSQLESQSEASSYHPVTDSLLTYWRSDAFAKRQAQLTLITLASSTLDDSDSVAAVGMEFVESEDKMDPTFAAALRNNTAENLEPGSLIASGTANWEHWDEPRLMLDCFLDCIRSDPDNFDLLFTVVIGVHRLRSVAGLHPLRSYLEHFLPAAPVSWHRRLFLHFVGLVRQRLSESHPVDFWSTGFGSSIGITVEDTARLLAHLVLPSVTHALELGSPEEYLGCAPSPFTESDEIMEDCLRHSQDAGVDLLPGERLTDLDYADDKVLLFDDFQTAQAMLDAISRSAKYFGMRFATSKCKVLLQDCCDYVDLMLDDVVMEVVDRFVYLGSCISSGGGVGNEIEARISKARAVFANLRHLWRQRCISLKLKGRVYKTTFAWPCTTSSLSVADLQEKYSGLRLLANLTAKFESVRTVASQVFHCLAKGAHTETKKIVNPALDILIPAWICTPDDHVSLRPNVMSSVLFTTAMGIIVRHADLYYPVRNQLLPHIILIISRLSAQQLPIEQRRLALDMIETAARWDHRCRQTLTEADSAVTDEASPTRSDRPTEAVDTSQNGNLSEASVLRALSQLEFTLRSDVWGAQNCELRLSFIDRYFAMDDATSIPGGTSTGPGGQSGLNTSNVSVSSSAAASKSGSNVSSSVTSAVGNLGAAQTTNLLMTLDVLRILFTSLESPTLLHNVKYFGPGLCSLLNRQLTNVRLIRSCSNLLRAILERFPADVSNRQKITTHAEFLDIYSATLKIIQESFTLYSENGPKPTLIARLQSAFLLFTATQVRTNPYAFVDRCIVQLVKLTRRLIPDVLSPGSGSVTPDSGASAQLTDLLITGLEVIKSRLNVVSNEMRKSAFGPDLCTILDRARDARLFRAVICILRDWINVPKSEEHFAPTAREKVHFFHKLWQAYPRWLDLSPDVAREILECVYEVYVSGNLFKNHDLYMKLEQAFCCSLLAPFPDIREKFTLLYMEASQLHHPSAQATRMQSESVNPGHEASTNSLVGDEQPVWPGSSSSSPRPHTDVPEDQDASDSVGPLMYTSAPLVVRLLFLLVSCNWDEAHFRDGFWLPLFFDVTFRDGFKGLLCLIHRSPALATHLFGQLWHQLWNGLLLRQTQSDARFCEPYHPPSTTSVPGSCDVAMQDVNEEHATNTDLTVIGNETSNGQNLSVNEILCFVIPQLLHFLTSDQHVNPAEPQPSALGAFLEALMATPDTTLSYLPIPAISYIGSNYNQWHTVALFTEFLCAEALKTNSSSDFIYNMSLPPADSSEPYVSCDLPTGAAALSLVSVYDSINDVDYLTAAWWYRLTMGSSDSVSHPISVRSNAMLKCLEYAQHGHTLRALESALDQLATSQSTGSSGSYSDNLGLPGGSASSNRAAAAASARPPTSSSSNFTPLTYSAAYNQFGEHVNRSRLHEYCVRYLKQLGQWDSLESLASSAQTTGPYLSMSSSSGSLGSSGPGGPASSSNTSSACGGSAYWGLKADAAWRRSDWSEVYSSLAKLANECPRSELCRYSVIQGAASVAGRRTSGFTSSTPVPNNPDIDAYGSANLGTASGDLQSSSSGPTANSSGSVNSATLSSGPPSSMNPMISMLQASELENRRVMTTVLREWRRLPMIVTSQHVPLLQIAHRAVEVTEGNSLLAQYCGHLLGGTSFALSLVPGASYPPSPAQTSSVSATPTSGQSTGPSTASTTASLRMPLSQAWHDYKTVFKSWQSRPPSMSDDLGFWHDLFSWRQVVEETIISCHLHMQKFGPERTHLVAVCERELALNQLQLARGARKHRFPSIAQQHLDRYTRMNLPPLFEKTKQEIKLKMFEVRKDELLEGLELMEKTNIQQYEKKDRAKFFCYKAVFFSHFNKGDEATKNFGYATQMQDNIHKVWSIYGDFLENVYSSYPAAKREIAVSTTGIFAMQALMEAASVAGGFERRSRPDIAKCLWLLTLDDAKGQQRLARTFEERSSRVRPDAFLPWLPNLVASLLRPEGRFIVPALRGVVASHPTTLYNSLRGLHHQLSTELQYDGKLGQLSHAEASNLSSFARALQSRITSAIGLNAEDSDRKKSKGQHLTGTVSAGDGTGTPRRTGLTSSSVGSVAKIVNSITSVPLGSLATVSSNVSPQCNLITSKKKKRVIVVMRGVEGERLSGSPSSPSLHKNAFDETDVSGSAPRSEGLPKRVVVRGLDSADEGCEEITEDADEFEVEEEAEEPETDREDTDPAASKVTVVDTSALRRRHPARLYAMDLFTNEIGGRLQPTWAEQLLAQLCSLLDYLHQLAWAVVSPGRSWRIRNLHRLCVSTWLASEMRCIGTACGLSVPNMLVANEGDQDECVEEAQYVQGVTELSSLVGSPSSRDQKNRDRSNSSSDSEVDQREAVKKSSKNKKHPLKINSGRRPAGASEKTARYSGTSPGRIPIQKSPATHASMPPAYEEVERLFTAKLTADAMCDPWFPRTRERLSKEMSNLEDQPVLFVMERLTHCWIPLVEDYVARLPSRMHLTDYGARRLMELPGLVIGDPQSPTFSAGSSTAPHLILPNPSCFELPGESGLLQSVGGLLQSSVASGSHAPYGHMTPTSAASSMLINGTSPHSALQLVVAEFLPHLARVRCSPGRLSPPARRLGIRASNGRVFYYDLACLGYPITVGMAAVQLASVAGARTCDLIAARGREPTMGSVTTDGLCVSAYNSWRQSGPLQLFQMINDILSGQSESAKRRLSLFVPRFMEVGPCGLCITEVGASAPAASVGSVNANPLPSANPVSARGLTVLSRPPPLVSTYNQTSNETGPSCTSTSRPPSWTLPFAPSDDLRSTSEQGPVKPSLPVPPPGPLPTLLTSGSGHLSNVSVGGSFAVAAEASGRPSGLEGGCHPAVVSLFGVLEQACASWINQPVESNTPAQFDSDGSSSTGLQYAVGAREVIFTYYEQLLRMKKYSMKSKTTASFLGKLFRYLSEKIPPYPYVKSPLMSALRSLTYRNVYSNERTDVLSTEFPRASLLQRWAANRMWDAESYWLFRHTVASHLGLIGLMEHLFHLTPLHPGCLVLDPRSGRAEARHLRFGLPPNQLPMVEPVSPTLSQHHQSSHQSHSSSTDKCASGSSQLTICFVQAMSLGMHNSSDQTLSSDADSTHYWRIAPDPVPFRLTPNLAGFVCLPGAPAHVGPLAASFAVAAQALSSAQRSRLGGLYRTLLRGDYILWHRGRQAAVHAFQLLLGGQPWLADSLSSSGDSDSDEAEPGWKRKKKLFDELGVSSVRPGTTDREYSDYSTLDTRTVLVPDLTNEHLIQLITLTVDAMSTSLKVTSDYSGREPNAWSFIRAAVDPSNLAQMNPDWLPWM